MFPVYQITFYFFAALLILTAIMVILAKNPVKAILFLVLTFFSSAILWMMLQAEFLSLVLIFVYVGAVMTLFLFVVMMLNIDLAQIREKFVHYLPIGILLMLLFIALLLMALVPQHLRWAMIALPKMDATYSNTQALGILLYTHYLYPFEIAGVILLVAIIAAIALAFRGKKKNTKSQIIAKQQKVRKEHRLRIIKMKAEKEHDPIK